LITTNNEEMMMKTEILTTAGTTGFCYGEAERGMSVVCHYHDENGMEKTIVDVVADVLGYKGE
jgi:hypothetical protein